MAETLYTTFEGPKGTVDVYEIVQEHEPDEWEKAGQGSARARDVLYEVRFGAQRESFWVEGEATTLACEWAGITY